MIEIKNVKKDYVAGDMSVAALKGVSISFRDNEFVSILGPSGCGKTTLLNIVGGLDKYTDGDIVIDGVSTKDYKDRDWDTYRNHYIGFVFQSYNLIAHLSILENVELALSIAGLNRKEKREKAIEALEKVGLKDQIKKKPNQLSGGQMQRVAIARAIVNNPKIILADEPTGALDSGTSVQIMDILKEISKSCLVVMVTHNRELAEIYSDRIIGILDGEITHDSNPYKPTEEEKSGREETKEEKVTADEDLKAKKGKTKKPRQSAMGFLTAFSLSFKNLISKKMKTILVSFAGSIGIIGIALVLSVSNGLNNYIASMQSDTLSGYPVSIGTVAVDFDSITNMGELSTDTDIDRNKEIGLYSIADMMQQFGSFNYLDTKFVDYITKYYNDDQLKDKNSRELIALNLSYNTNMQVLTEVSEGVVVRLDSKTKTSVMNSTITSGVFYQGISNKDYVLENYDVLGGENAHYPENKNEVALVVGKSDSIATETLMQYGIILDKSLKEYEFSKLLDKEYKILSNDTYYQEDKDFQAIVVNDLTDMISPKVSFTEMLNLYNNASNTSIKISCILRAKDDVVGEVLSEGIMYTPELTDYLREQAKNSKIYEATMALGATDKLIIPFNMEFSELSMMGDGAADLFKYSTLQEMVDKVNAEPFNLNMKVDDCRQLALQMIGASDTPNAISIYTNSFNAKQNLLNHISEWNSEEHDLNNKITYSDATAFLTETLGTLIDIISYVLIAFAGIALVVSSIMIGIITYTSVVERTKEIGVLRSIGARKKDISRVFNSETLIIGFVAGTLGVLISWALTFPISAIIKSVAGGAITSSMAILKFTDAAILVAISTVLTLISGLIPARIASKKDPVKALRTE